MTLGRNFSKYFGLAVAAVLFQSTLFAQTFTKGPYLADPEKHAITIRWESDTKADFKVSYGKNKLLSQYQQATLIAEKEKHYLYQSKINHIEPGHLYYYQVSVGEVQSPLSTFKTAAPTNSPFRFAVIGDSRTKQHVFRAIIEQMSKENPDIILSTGDLVALGGAYEQWGTHFFNVAYDLINHIPLISAVGDHEADEVDGDEAKLFTHFLFPEKDHLKLWYSFDYGNAHFVALDYRYPDNERMIEWFKNDMKKSNARWKFVFMHRPGYNLGGHRSFWGKEIWPRLFREYQVDIVFAGHSHNYERFYPTRPLLQPDSFPVTYITSGGAGAPLYSVVQHPALAMAKSINHFVLIDLYGDRLRLKTILRDGTVLDEISWTKNENGLGENYLALVKPQDELDVIGIFAGPISQSLERLPMVRIPAEPVVKLKSVCVNEDIDFEIRLADASRANYDMEAVKGTLKVGETLHVPLKIYAKKTMTVTRWGELKPVLRFIVDYKTRSFQGQVIGKVLSYRAY